MVINNLNTKHLMRAHTIIGLFAIFLFYIAGFFGTITVFRPYIKTWETPSRYFVKTQDVDLNKALSSIYLRRYPKQLEIHLESKHDNAVSISDLKSKTVYINPNTNEKINRRYEKNFLSNFFNELHVNATIPKVGQTLMGIASFFIVFLCLSGVILWLNKVKTNAKKKFFYKWHKNLSLVLLPYILVFALSGAILGFMLGNSTPLALGASKMQESSMRALVAPILFPKDEIPKRGKKAKMLEFKKLEQIAKEKFPNLEITQINLTLWKYEGARIKYSGYLKDDKALSGRVNRMHIILSGVNGDVIKIKNLDNTNLSNKMLSSFYYFHFITDEKALFRIIYGILGVVFCISLSFGYIIYVQNKAKKDKQNKNYYNILSKFAISTMIGLIPATSFLMFLYWYLPFDLYERALYLKGGFYSFWALTLLIVAYKDETLKAINILSLFSSLFLILTVIFHQIHTSMHLLQYLQKGLYEVFFIDLILLILAILFFIFAIKSKDIKLLNNNKDEK